MGETLMDGSDMQGWAYQLEIERRRYDEEEQAIRERARKKREVIKHINQQRRINDGITRHQTTSN
jgi:hypothetical protein